MSVSPQDEMLQKLNETRSRLEAEIEALRNQIRGIELAYRALGGRVAALERKRAPRGNVKSMLLGLLEDSGPHGLNAQTAVKVAATQGVQLDRNTVSSLLSRLKRYGVVDHDGERYRLKNVKTAGISATFLTA